MHRSGTTMLARLLSECSVFMGREVTGNHESVFFQNLNREILDFFGCCWAAIEDLPPSSELAGLFPGFRRRITRRIIEESPGGHFGWTDGARPLPPQWGWKDPRNSLTLPFYREVFPEARIVFLHRDPRDVAISLIRREEKARGEDWRYDPSVARKRFEKFLALWEAYNRRALEDIRLFKVRAAIRYESFVRSPEDAIGSLLRFLEVPAPEGLAEKARAVKTDRIRVHETEEGERFRGISCPEIAFEDGYFRG